MSLGKWAIGGCCCGCNVTICVTACPGTTPLSGASVTIKRAGVTIASGTTPVGGCVTLDIGTAGASEVIISQAGYITYDRVRTLNCGDTVSTSLSTSVMVTFHVTSSCGTDLEGATVIFEGASQATDSTGHAYFGITDAGTFSWSVSKSRYVSGSGTVTLSYCSPTSPVNVILNVDTGYHCGPSVNCNGSNRDPATADTLFLTDSVYGAATLSYDATDGHWRGTHAYSFGGACGFSASTGVNVLIYDFDPSGNAGKGLVKIGLHVIATGTNSYFAKTVSGCTATGALDWIGTRDFCTTPGVCDGTLQCAMWLAGVTITITE